LQAALEVYKMLKDGPAYIWNNIAAHSEGLGVFTAPEKITIFPQNANLADRTECHGR
jgi:hypothetical protein